MNAISVRGWSRLTRKIAVWVALVAAVPAWAHDPGLSTALLSIRADTMELSASFAPTDMHAFLPATARPTGPWSEKEFTAVRGQLEKLAPHLWEIRADGADVSIRSAKVVLNTGDNLDFTVVYLRPPGGAVTVKALELENLASGHREYFTAVDEQGARLVEKLLSAKEPTAVFTLPVASASAAISPGAGAPTFWGFLRLGVEHIWTGYDHLLFLFGLLVVCRTFKSIVTIITCFTLAHSITLALATLDIVNLPSRFVEPAIAASIVFVGLENLVRRGGEPRGRWALTFFFGLIHGFGFASVLRELGVGADGHGLAMPLFTFNLGVELGQVAVASIVLPLVWQLRKKPWFLSRGVTTLSVIVAAAGAYWFLERTVFG